MGNSKWRAVWVAGLLLAVLAGAARDARAQRLGLGARMVSVSGPESPALDSSDSSRTRFAGGLIRLHATNSLAIEASMDYQSSTNAAGTASIRNMPIQISGMLIPIRKSFAPFALAGIGWYSTGGSARQREGRGLRELHRLRVSRRSGRAGEARQSRAIFADYRYVWVDANGIDGISGALKKAASYTTVVGLLSTLAGGNAEESSISRGGSMWTGGLTIYF